MARYDDSTEQVENDNSGSDDQGNLHFDAYDRQSRPVGTRKVGDVGDASEIASLIQLNATDESQRFERQGNLLLADAHKDLKITTDGSHARTFAHDPDYEVKTDTTVEALARRLLGLKVSKEQLTEYIDTLVAANGLTGGAKAKVSQGRILSIPGHTADGGITYMADEKKVTVWQDGSSKTEEPSGAIKIVFATKKGETVIIQSDPSNLENNYELKSKDGRGVKIDALGRRIELKIEKKEGAEDTHLPVKITQGEQTYEIRRAKNEEAPNKVILSEKGKPAVEFKLSQSGELLTKDGRRGILFPSLERYDRKVARDGEITQTFPNGDIRKLDDKGNVTSNKWKDSIGRTFEQKFRSGDADPREVILTPAGGGARSITFERTRAGRYEALLMKDGRKIGYSELVAPEGILITHDKSRGITTAQYSDGRSVETTDLPHSRAKEVTRTAQGETLTVTRDRQSIIKEQQFEDGKGTTVKAEIGRDGKSSAVTVVKDGSRTELKFDRDLGVLTGKRTARDGSTETVTLVGNKLMCMDDKTKVLKTEIMDWPTAEKTPVFTESRYDANQATVSYRLGKQRIIEPLAPGRVDVVAANGTIEGRAVNGETSHLKPNGEAVVQHSDGRRVRLNADNTVDRWGPGASDTAKGERLSAAESTYLKNHSDIDRRDFAEVHRRFSDRPILRDKFFRALAEIDDAKNLSAGEKTALRKNLMSHVARPSEIYQGSSMCCNVATIQRDMAITMPDRYVNVVLNSLSKQEIPLADGKTQKVDGANLKMADTTGRDMATRAFQTLAVGLAFPGGTFKNTVDGVGILRDSDENRAAFDGIHMGQIALVRKLLTGQEKPVIHVDRMSDLVDMFNENGGRSMTIHVDATKPPFGAGGPVGDLGSHVVTLTRIDKGPPTMFYVQNQWGLTSDHSTKETAIPADILWAAMTANNEDAKVIATTAGGKLDHTKVYTFKDGKLKVDDEKTKEQAGVLERWKR